MAAKFEAIQRDPRVSYTLDHLPPDGFYGRQELRSIQVEGRASIVTNHDEIQWAIQLSHEQISWLKDAAMYKGLQERCGTPPGVLPGRACQGSLDRQSGGPALAQTDHLDARR